MRLHASAKEDMIRHVPLFAECSKGELTAVAHLADELDLATGARLTKEGAAGHEFVVIVEGTADVMHGDEKINSLGPGDFLGEMSLLTGEPRTATVVATSPVHALVVAHHDFRQLMTDSPSVGEKIRNAADQRRSELS